MVDVETWLRNGHLQFEAGVRFLALFQAHGVHVFPFTRERALRVMMVQRRKDRKGETEDIYKGKGREKLGMERKTERKKERDGKKVKKERGRDGKTNWKKEGKRKEEKGKVKEGSEGKEVSERER